MSAVRRNIVYVKVIHDSSITYTNDQCAIYSKKKKRFSVLKYSSFIVFCNFVTIWTMEHGVQI